MKTKNSNNYLKLIGMKIMQVLRTAGTVTSGLAIIYFAVTSMMNYFKSKVFPSMSEICFLIASLVAFITLRTLKSACDEAVSEISTNIKRSKELKKHKEELEYQYEQKLAETKIQQQAFDVEMEMIAMKKFDVTKVDKDDVKAMESLIGLESVKEQLNKFRATIDYEKKYGGGKTNTVFHMKFIGNPGTGKTTVAKIMVSILYEAGIINKPKYIAVNGNDLMGKYTGQTAPTVDALFKQGKEGVIFIDEAYAMVNAASNDGNGYGHEAVNQLLTHLEAKDNKTVVIFGGYEEPMNRFFDMNPGLRSRVPLTLMFPDYNEEELFQILELNLRKMGHEIREDVEQVLIRIFSKKRDICKRYNLPFSNGRYARNIAEELHSQHAVNYSKDNSIGTIISLNDIRESILLELD